MDTLKTIKIVGYNEKKRKSFNQLFKPSKKKPIIIIDSIEENDFFNEFNEQIKLGL